MAGPCNRPGCAFCAGDVANTYCEGCHVLLGPVGSVAYAVCDSCHAARVRRRAHGEICPCPPAARREVVVHMPDGDRLECARCLGLIRDDRRSARR